MKPMKEEAKTISSTDDLELPDWIKTLIEAGKEEAYQKGRDDGYRFAIETMRRKLSDIDHY